MSVWYTIINFVFECKEKIHIIYNAKLEELCYKNVLI